MFFMIVLLNYKIYKCLCFNSVQMTINMKQLLLIGLLLFSSCGHLSAQTKNYFNWGIIPSTEEEIGKIPLAVSFGQEAFYPLVPSYDLSPDMPPAGDQGKPLSCGAFAIAYGIKTYYEKKKNNWNYYLPDGKPDLSKIFSPAFIYNLAKIENRETSCGSGAKLVVLLDHYRNSGMPPLSDFGYDATGKNPCVNPKDLPNVMDIASRYKMAFPERIATLDQMRFHLSRNMPVLVELAIDTTFAQQGNAADGTVKQFRWDPPQFSIYSKGASIHAMTCIGYDKNGFEFLNSWGTNWGHKGKVYIPNAVLDSYKGIMFVIYDLPEANVSAKPAKPAGATVSDGMSLVLRTGQYNVLHNLKVSLQYISLTGDAALLEISDALSGDLVNKMYLQTGQSKKFEYDKNKYLLKFESAIRDEANPQHSKLTFTLLKNAIDDQQNNAGLKPEDSLPQLYRELHTSRFFNFDAGFN